MALIISRRTGRNLSQGGAYDLVWFWNLTREIRIIKRHTDAKIFAIAVEPECMWKENYDRNLVCLCDFYMGYRNLLGPKFWEKFQRLIAPATTVTEVTNSFDTSMSSRRRYDFCIFARHDPNIRRSIADALDGYKAIVAGPLFNNPQETKLPLQRLCRYEFITENEINTYYFSEKLGQSLLAGCVPVYYGCTKIQNYFPKEFFIDLHKFMGTPDRSGLKKAIDYCLRDGVYEYYFNNIVALGKSFLQEHMTFEGNVIKPLRKYVQSMKQNCFCSRKDSLFWQLSRFARRIQSVYRLKKLWPL